MKDHRSNKLFHYRLFKLESVNAMLLRNQGRPLLGIIARLFPAMGGRLSVMRISDCKEFLRKTNLIARRQGIKGAVMYLKVSGVAVQQAIAGHVLKDLTPLGPRVGRNKKGLPTLLPSNWRYEISKGNTFVMILSLTMISLYRVLSFPANAKLSTITGPFKGNMEIMKTYQRYVPKYVRMIMKPLTKRGMTAFDWVKGKTTPFPILSSSPTSVSSEDEISTSPRAIWRALYSYVLRNEQSKPLISNLFLKWGGKTPSFLVSRGPSDYVGSWSVYPEEGTLFHSLLQILNLGGKGIASRFTWSNITKSTRIWYDTDLVTHPSFDTMWSLFSESNMFNWVLDMSQKIYNSKIPSFSKRDDAGPVLLDFRALPGGQVDIRPHPAPLGKLGFKDEAAGKVRVFAMVDAISQWALRPIHKLLFKLLGAIPMDGTFDQLKPITRLIKQNPKVLDSLDLSAATDRLPVLIQEWIISQIFSPSIGKAWRSLLVGREYSVPYREGQTKLLPKSVTYSVGQPMGALSSWAMLAITHHFIVQLAAWQVGVARPGTWFTTYALLGDDLTVGNRAVSKRYQTIMIKHLGVEIGLAKSIISDRGIGLEFAKKTFYKGVDVSPRPFKELLGALQSPAALASYGRKYHLTDANLIKVAGFGYKVLGGLNKPLQKQNTSVRFTLITLHLPKSLNDLRLAYVSMRNWFKRHDMVEWLIKFIAMEARILRSKLGKTDSKLSRIYSDLDPRKSPFADVPAWLTKGLNFPSRFAQYWNGMVKPFSVPQTLVDISFVVLFDYSYRMRHAYSKIMDATLRISDLEEANLALHRDFGMLPGETFDQSFKDDLYYIFLESLQESSRWSLDSLSMTRPEIDVRYENDLRISRFWNSFNRFIVKFVGKTRTRNVK